MTFLDRIWMRRPRRTRKTLLNAALHAQFKMRRKESFRIVVGYAKSRVPSVMPNIFRLPLQRALYGVHFSKGLLKLKVAEFTVLSDGKILIKVRPQRINEIPLG